MLGQKIPFQAPSPGSGRSPGSTSEKAPQMVGASLSREGQESRPNGSPSPGKIKTTPTGYLYCPPSHTRK